MNLSEILSVLWHRKWVVVLVTALALGCAVAALRLVDPVYESTSTLALRLCGELANDLLFFQTIDAIVLIYATAATTRTTLDEAEAQNGGRLADISVRTFEGAPIIKIDARGPTSGSSRTRRRPSPRRCGPVERGEVGIPSLTLSQIDRPALPTEPVFPDWMLTIAVAVLLGVAIGVGTALLLANLTTRIRTRDDLADASGLPVFAELPNEGRSSARSPDVLSTSPSLRAISEGLRDLRTNSRLRPGQRLLGGRHEPRGQPRKTTVAFGLAVAMARAGARTLLVDADLRRGRVAEMLGLERVPGLYEALGGARLDGGVVRRTSMSPT